MRDERFLAFTAPLRRFRQGELVLSAQPFQRCGKIAADLAQKLFQRIVCFPRDGLHFIPER